MSAGLVFSFPQNRLKIWVSLVYVVQSDIIYNCQNYVAAVPFVLTVLESCCLFKNLFTAVFIGFWERVRFIGDRLCPEPRIIYSSEKSNQPTCPAIGNDYEYSPSII